MLKFNLAAGSLAVLLLVGSGPMVSAEAPYQHVQQSTLADIRTAIVRSIGAQDQTVEITLTDKVLMVLRLNSNMNEATHAGRDNEATAIASIVSTAIKGKPEFDNLVALRVDYVARSAGGESKVIDSVEFREDPIGDFRFHRT